MTLTEYQEEYERLFRWRDLWLRLSNKREPRLAKRQEAIERRTQIANNAIGRLIARYDRETKEREAMTKPNEALEQIAFNRKLAERIADDLFTSGRGVEAYRLVLSKRGEDDGRTGWAKKPVADRIEDILNADLASAVERLARFVIVETDRGVEVWPDSAGADLTAIFTSRSAAELFVKYTSKSDVDRINNAAMEIAKSFPDLNYSDSPIDPNGEMVRAIVRIISTDFPCI